MPSYTREQPNRRVQAAWNLLTSSGPLTTSHSTSKLFIPLFSKLAKGHTECMPGSMLARGDGLTPKRESDPREARSLVQGAERVRSTTKLHTSCQRHFSTGFCTT